MEERREQQPPPVPVQPAVYPPAPQPYAAYQNPGYAAAPPYAAPAPRPNIVLRVLRLMLRRVLYGMVIVGRAVRPRIFSVGIIVALLCVVAVLALQLAAPRLSFGGQVVDTRTPALAPPPAVQEFLQGQQTFDAEKIWNSFSPRFQAALLDNGTTKEVLQVRIESERSSGQRYVNYNYIGGAELSDGRSMFFYMVQVQSARAGQNEFLSFVFTVDRDGKIIGFRG